MLRTLSLAGLWQWKQTLEPDEGRYYASIRSLETTVIFEYVTTLLLLILPVKPTPYITIIVWNMKKKKKNGAPCFRKLIFWSQKFRHLKTITYKSMQNCWYSTFDIKEALNERKKCYQNLFSNERIFKQKKHMAYLWTSKSRLWGAQTASKSMEQLNGWISERHLS